MLPWNRALWLDVASHKTVLLVPILVNFVEPNLTYPIIIYKGQFRIKKGSDVSKQFYHSIVMQHSDWMFQVTRLFLTNHSALFQHISGCSEISLSHRVHTFSSIRGIFLFSCVYYSKDKKEICISYKTVNFFMTLSPQF